MKQNISDKPKLTAARRKAARKPLYLTPKVDSNAKMSRGQPIPVGPTARLPQNVTWESLAKKNAGEIRNKGIFPYPSLPHPKHSPGGMVFPQVQIDMFPRLERFDVEHDLPDAFLPEFLAAMFLQSRPELGDVSRAKSCRSTT